MDPRSRELGGGFLLCAASPSWRRPLAPRLSSDADRERPLPPARMAGRSLRRRPHGAATSSRLCPRQAGAGEFAEPAPAPALRDLLFLPPAGGRAPLTST